MKKFSKIILAFTLALSSLMFVSLSDTQNAYAASSADCKKDSNCGNFVKQDLVVNHYIDLWGMSKLEVKSGSSYVKIEDGVRIKGIKPGGEVVIYAYDKSGKYVMYSITVLKTIFG
ncbi:MULTISPECIES: hypothetical protein [unclassified Lysinibacillus]|uniref:hypothetical protein n=1 Tax=unclassified Lysinibacillus TaxID=2636778 RepID=UPI00382D8F4B